MPGSESESRREPGVPGRGTWSRARAAATAASESEFRLASAGSEALRRDGSTRARRVRRPSHESSQGGSTRASTILAAAAARKRCRQKPGLAGVRRPGAPLPDGRGGGGVELLQVCYKVDLPVDSV